MSTTNPEHTQGRALTRMLAAVTIAALLPSVAVATTGYFSHGYGTQSKAMGGAGVALASSALAPATNPASLAFLDARIDVGVAYFAPRRDYTVTGAPSGMQGTFGLAPGKVKSESESFVVPSLGVNWRPTDRFAVGLAAYGNGGMNTDYDAPTFGAARTGVDLSQGFVAPTFAYRMGSHALGVTPIFAYQAFEAQGLAAFGGYSCDTSCLTDNGHATSSGWGARIGYLGELIPQLKIAAAYQSRLAMSEFEDYKGLFAENGDFDIPESWTVGLAATPMTPVTVAVDLQHIRYSDVDAVANPLMPNLGQSQLGSSTGAGFGWQDMTIVKTGVAWQAHPMWTLRGGYAYGEQPIGSEDVLFNILAPGVVEQHVTFGLTRTLGTSRALHLAVMRGLSSSISGPNPLEVPGQQEIELRMDQWEVEASFTFGL